MLTNRVIDRDRGWERIKRQLKHTTEKSHVVFGVLSEKGERDSEWNNAQLASVHEFGSVDGKIPERSFLRSTMDDNQDKYKRLAKTLMIRIIAGTLTTKIALGLFGQKVKADVINKINNGIEPALKESTIAAKGSSKPLIDTGQLKQSLDYDVRGV